MADAVTISMTTTLIGLTSVIATAVGVTKVYDWLARRSKREVVVVVDERIGEHCPIVHAVVDTRFAAVEEKIGAGLKGVHARVDGMSGLIAVLSGNVGELNGTVAAIREDLTTARNGHSGRDAKIDAIARKLGIEE